MSSYPEIRIGDIRVNFWPDNILRINACTSDQVRLLELHLKKGQFVFNPQARHELPEGQKNEIILAVEKSVNDWVKDHPVERLEIEEKVLLVEIDREEQNIVRKREYLQTMREEVERSISNSNESIKDHRERLSRLESEKLDAMRKVV